MARLEAGDSTERAASGNAGPSPRLSRWQRRGILVAFSLVASLLVLGLLEGSLRLAGYGGYGSTFVDAGELPDGSSLVFTDHAGPASYFFANRSRAGSLKRDAFLMPKPEDTLRVFVVGGSAAKGNPYSRPLTGASFLEAMLSDLRPRRDVEVINLGTTAVGAFPVLGMMTEALEYDPDLVVVYTGNNEFYGAYGVASLHSAGRSPAMIRLIRATRSTAIAQLFDGLLRGPARRDQKTLMEAMVGQSYIPPDAPARKAAARNLEAFVGSMIDRCGAQGVPVVVCTPPCNERGLAPLGGDGLSVLAGAERAGMEDQLGTARRLLPEDPAGAAAALREALAIDGDNATAHYLLARALEAQDLAEDAAREYRRAVDLDPMPWRAPSSSVEAIRRAAESRGVMLSDLQASFRRASDGGAIGWALLDDHVHASLRGQDLIARTIVTTLADEGTGALAFERTRVDDLPGWEAYAERLGWNRYEQYAAAHRMRRLGSIPFFRETNPRLFERFDRVCRRIEMEASDGVRRSLEAWQDPSAHRGEFRPITAMVARAMFNAGRFAEAAPLFEVATRTVAPYGTWEVQYAYATLLCRQRVKGSLDEADLRMAARYAERGEAVLSLGPSRTGGTERFTGELLLMRGEAASAIPYLEAATEKLTGADRLGADVSLARAYVRTGRRDEAVALAERRAAHADRFAEYYTRLLAELRAGREPG